MIRRVDRDRLGAVVDRDVDRSLDRGLDAGRGPPSAGEHIYYQFTGECALAYDLNFRVSHVRSFWLY